MEWNSIKEAVQAILVEKQGLGVTETLTVALKGMHRWSDLEVREICVSARTAQALSLSAVTPSGCENLRASPLQEPLESRTVSKRC